MVEKATTCEHPERPTVAAKVIAAAVDLDAARSRARITDMQRPFIVLTDLRLGRGNAVDGGL